MEVILTWDHNIRFNKHGYIPSFLPLQHRQFLISCLQPCTTQPTCQESAARGVKFCPFKSLPLLKGKQKRNEIKTTTIIFAIHIKVIKLHKTDLSTSLIG